MNTEGSVAGSIGGRVARSPRLGGLEGGGGHGEVVEE